MSAIVAIAIAAFVAICIYKYVQWIELRRDLPPGPTPLPLFGNLLQLDKKDLRLTYQKWRKQYGPIFTVWLGLDPCIFVGDAKLMDEIFVKHGDKVSDRPVHFAFDHFVNGKNGIINANGDKWREQRRFSLQVLREFGLGRQAMEERIASESSILANSICKDLAGQSKSKSEDVVRYIDRCVGNIICSVSFGRTFELGDPTFLELKRLTEENFETMMTTPVFLLTSYSFLRYVPLFNNFGYSTLEEQRKKYFAIIEDEVIKHKKRLLTDSTEESDFIYVYLKEMKKRKDAGDVEHYFDEWQLKCIIHDLMVAGLDTTVVTIQWAILFMMLNPDMQKRVQQEIEEIIGLERKPTMADKPRMPYTIAVLNETQRRGNIVPMNAFRVVQEDLTINGYHLPKGVKILPQVCIAMMDETAFPNSNEFIPVRFLEQDGQTLKKFDEFLPFSVGKRICFGEGLARTELFLIFVSLMQKLSFSLPHGCERHDLSPLLGLTMSPKPFEVCITKRN